MRGKTLVTTLAVVSLVAGACGQLQLGRQQGGSTPGSPDPATAIALSVLSDSIYLVDPATGQFEAIQRGLTDYQSGFAAWAPDHVQLAWGAQGIRILDTRTGQQRVLVGDRSLSMPAWSPGGTDLVYGDGTRMWITPTTTARPAALRLPQTIAPFGMDWGQGKTIAFEGLELDCSTSATCVSTDRSDIWTVRPDGSRLRQVTTIGHADNPRWSPDGSRLLFVRSFPQAKRPKNELWVINSSGAEPAQLLPATDVVAADWSPDGSAIAVVRTTGGPGNMQLWLYGADGSSAHSLGQPFPGTDATVDW